MQNLNAESTSSTSSHILLVDDDHINQLLTIRVLANYGLSVTVANHGAEALNLIHSKNFVLVLMDIQMPVMDGYEATRQIRLLNDPYFKNIPILAYTSCSLEHTRKSAQLSGMNDILYKSFDAPQMHDKINYYIKMASSGNHNYRPINIKFDIYSESDDISFKSELLSLMVSNIKELKEAAHHSHQLNEPVAFQKSAHKVKATTALLDDREFSEAIEEMKEELSHHGTTPNLEKLNKFNEICESIICSLERETQLLQSS